jgi:hypothetical protein
MGVGADLVAGGGGHGAQLVTAAAGERVHHVRAQLKPLAKTARGSTQWSRSICASMASKNSTSSPRHDGSSRAPARGRLERLPLGRHEDGAVLQRRDVEAAVMATGGMYVRFMARLPWKKKTTGRGSVARGGHGDCVPPLLAATRMVNVCAPAARRLGAPRFAREAPVARAPASAAVHTGSRGGGDDGSSRAAATTGRAAPQSSPTAACMRAHAR